MLASVAVLSGGNAIASQSQVSTESATPTTRQKSPFKFPIGHPVRETKEFFEECNSRRVSFKKERRYAGTVKVCTEYEGGELSYTVELDEDYFVHTLEPDIESMCDMQLNQPHENPFELRMGQYATCKSQGYVVRIIRRTLHGDGRVTYGAVREGMGSDSRCAFYDRELEAFTLNPVV